MRCLGKNIILILCATIGLFSCSEKREVEGELLISETQMQMEIGDMEVLTLLYNGKILDNNEAQWTSTNSEVAIVTAGIVEAQTEGSAVIKATYNGLNAECKIDVVSDPREDLSASVRYLKKSKKRGVGYSFAQFPEQDVETLKPHITWCYNWGSSPSSAQISTLLDNANIEYIPMAWNGVNEAQIRAYKASHPNCQYILAFNEPNLTDQANMTPQQAAEKWPALKSLADELGLKIVSPAMNYGTLAGYSDPVKWMDEFFTLVPKSDVCAIALHCYMASSGGIYNFVHLFDKFDLPIWMTEFCAWDKPAPGSMQAQMEYMNEAVVMLENDPKVERYAWFIPRGSGATDSYPYMQLLSKTNIGDLSPQGEVYVAIPSFDKSQWLPTSAPILPNTYTDCSAAAKIRNGQFDTAPHLLPTSDNSGVLMMTGFVTDKWIEYQIDAVKALSKMLLRNIGIIGSKVGVSVDGVELAETTIPWSDSAWQTTEIALPLSQGKHTIRLTVKSGHIYYNWFKFE